MLYISRIKSEIGHSQNGVDSDSIDQGRDQMMRWRFLALMPCLTFTAGFSCPGLADGSESRLVAPYVEGFDIESMQVLGESAREGTNYNNTRRKNSGIVWDSESLEPDLFTRFLRNREEEIGTKRVGGFLWDEEQLADDLYAGYLWDEEQSAGESYAGYLWDEEQSAGELYAGYLWDFKV